MTTRPSSSRICLSPISRSSRWLASWMKFCDGPNAVFWVPGNSGENDELEAYVYDHPDCAPQFYQENPGQVPVGPPSDDDGISEEDED